MRVPDGVVLIGDQRVAAVPLRECGEALVDCRSVLRVDGRRADAVGHFAYLRSGVVERLRSAERGLPAGWRLLLVEGYRPPSLQQAIFDAYAGRLRAANPGWSAGEVWTAATRWVAPLSTGGHPAGAAVDLTAVDGDGVEVDMGTPEGANPEESGGWCFTAAPGLPVAARRNREVFGAALSSAGLVNYPTEWWHWSYGDRYWAYVSGAPAAVYGPWEASG